MRFTPSSSRFRKKEKRVSRFKSSSSRTASHSLLIRPLREGEEPELLAFIHSLFPKASPSFGPADHFLLASAGGRLIGFVHLREKPAHVYLQGIGVDAAWRRRGVGQRLLDSALLLVAERHPSRAVKLKVKVANQPALRLYLREGFQLSRALGNTYLLSKAPNN